jgi:hypothetical protein
VSHNIGWIVLPMAGWIVAPADNHLSEHPLTRPRVSNLVEGNALTKSSSTAEQLNCSL